MFPVSMVAPSLLPMIDLWVYFSPHIYSQTKISVHADIDTHPHRSTPPHTPHTQSRVILGFENTSYNLDICIRKFIVFQLLLTVLVCR